MSHFTLAELTRSETATKLKIANVPDEEQAGHLLYLIHKVLDPIRDAWGDQIIVNNGFRSPALNVALKGAKGSQHMCLGPWAAADIEDVSKANKKNLQLYALIQELHKKGVIQVDQCINEKAGSWIHVSVRTDGKGRGQFIALA